MTLSLRSQRDVPAAMVNSKVASATASPEPGLSLIAAAALYIPANIYPIMTVTYFGDGTPDTILSGVLSLHATGQSEIALLVFVASIVVPLFKLLALTYLAASVKGRSQWNPKARTKLYRFVEVIGRWSMLDIFMIAILVALVQLSSLASVDAGPGATAFAAVVVLTMFAAHSFDPRLIWDHLDETNEENDHPAQAHSE